MGSNMTLKKIMFRFLGIKLSLLMIRLFSFGLFFSRSNVQYLYHYGNSYQFKKYMERCRYCGFGKAKYEVGKISKMVYEYGYGESRLFDCLSSLSNSQPNSGYEAYRKIKSLISCMKLSRAKANYLLYRDQLSPKQSRRLKEFFSRIEVNFPNLNFFDDVFERTFSSACAGEVAVYLPGAFYRIDTDLEGDLQVFDQIIRVYSLLLKYLHDNKYTYDVKIQYFGVTIKEDANKVSVISYHTVGFRNRGIHVKESPFPYYFNLDRYGYSGWSEIAHKFSENRYVTDFSCAHDFYENIYSDYVKSGRSKYEQMELTNSNIMSTDYYFIPLQVVDDEVASLSIVSVLDLIDKIDRLSLDYPGIFVLKRHPRCKSPDVSRRLRSMESRGRVVISDKNVHELIRHCRKVITINSGVGFEALLHLKTVVAFGNSDYVWACRKLNCLNDLEREVFSENFINEEFIKKYLFIYFQYYLYRVGDPLDLGRLGFPRKSIEDSFN